MTAVAAAAEDASPAAGMVRRLLAEPVPALVAAGFAVALTTVVMAGFAQAMWSSRLPWLLLALGLGGPQLVALVRSRLRREAAAGLVWAGWCCASAALSSVPAMAFWGLYGWSTGAVLVLASVGLWAVGVRSGPRGAALLEKAILFGAIVNGLVALLEVVVDLHHLGIPPPGGQVSALFGNPAYLAAFLTGASWIAVRRVEPRPLVGGLFVFVLAAAIQLSGERLALALLVATCVLAGRRAPGRVAAAIAAAMVAGLVSGYVLADVRASAAPTSVERVVGGLSATARLESWLSARHAIAERPVFGWGPGRYSEATGRFRTLRLAEVQDTDEAYADAHNVVVEYATTTGIPGLLLFGGFVGLAFRSARSHPPLAGFALLLFTSQLLQPQHVAVTPLAFLALGTAAAAGVDVPALGWPTRVFAGAGTLCALAAAAVFAVGFAASYRVGVTGSIGPARTAARLLPPWPEPSLAVAHLRYADDQRAGMPLPQALDRLLAAERAIAELDPSDVNAWLRIGYDELQADRYDDAAADLHRAIEVSPWSTLAANGLGIIASETGKPDEAIHWFSRSLRAHPNQPPIRKALEDLRANRAGP